MLSHPLHFTGWLLAIIGFALLVFWVPTAVPSTSFGVRMDPVFNMHKAMISVSLMATGFVMIIVGALVGCSQMLLAGDDSRRAESAPVAVVPGAPNDWIEGEDLSQTRSVVTVKDRQGRDRELQVSSDGQALLKTITGLKVFESVDAAKAYLN